MNKQANEMNHPDYTPHPIDTSDIQLSEEMNQLVELIAHNVHDTWAQSRLKEGWTWGPTLDGDRKHHPCLVEYDELPETEKDYDRNTSIATLKTILKLGWTIEKPQGETIHTL